MTPAEEEGLQSLSKDLAGAEQSPWEPRCVARAFHRGLGEHAFVFTMQTWIDLDFAKSPFLQGELPTARNESPEELRRLLGEYETAFRAFEHVSTPAICTADELIQFGRKMIGAIERGFAMKLKMEPPEGFEAAATTSRDGFGDFLPVLACLKSQLHFSLAEALALPVKQALALIAAHRRNQNWRPAGDTYASRDIGTNPPATS